MGRGEDERASRVIDIRCEINDLSAAHSGVLSEVMLQSCCCPRCSLLAATDDNILIMHGLSWRSKRKRSQFNSIPAILSETAIVMNE